MPVDLKRTQKLLDERQIDTLLERMSIDDAKNVIKNSLREIENLMNSPDTTTSQKSFLFKNQMACVEFLAKYPDLPKDMDAERDFERFRSAVLEAYGPEGIGFIMMVYDGRYGTPEQRAEIASIVKDGPTIEQLKKYGENRLKQWVKLHKSEFL